MQPKGNRIDFHKTLVTTHSLSTHYLLLTDYSLFRSLEWPHKLNKRCHYSLFTTHYSLLTVHCLITFHYHCLAIYYLSRIVGFGLFLN